MTRPDTAPDDLPARWRDLIASSAYPPYCRRVLLDLVDLIDERQWSQTEAARLIRHGRSQRQLSTAALSQLLTGAYKADPVALCRAVEKTVAQQRARALFAVSGYVETRLAAVIRDLADIAVVTQRIACLHGGMLVGKTVNAIALAGDYPRASTVFLTAPYADTYGGFVRRLAAARGVDPRGALSAVRETILDTFDESHLLIVDEFHQPLTSYSRAQGLRVFEFLREINDLRRCGILLVGSTSGFAVLTGDDAYSRIASTITAVDARDHSPAAPAGAETDFASILRSFGLDPLPDRISILSRVARDHTVSRVFDTLRLAAARASARKQPLTWQHYLDASAPALRLAA